jgi:hypothetical protein
MLRSRLLRRTVIGYLIVTGLVVGVVISVRHQTSLDKLLGGSNYQSVAAGNSAKLKAAKIPATAAARAAAPAGWLLPSNWATAPTRKLSQVIGSMVVSAVPVNASEANKLASLSELFLARWETFRPLNAASVARYRSRLAPLTAPTALALVASQTEQGEPKIICASPVCTGGTTWIKLPPGSGQIVLRADDGRSAYLTRYGAISYQLPGQTLDGQKVVREYALTFSKLGGRWWVSRAVATVLVPA